VHRVDRGFLQYCELSSSGVVPAAAAAAAAGRVQCTKLVRHRLRLVAQVDTEHKLVASMP
jgi:hypothetical protein